MDVVEVCTVFTVQGNVSRAKAAETKANATAARNSMAILNNGYRWKIAFGMVMTCSSEQRKFRRSKFKVAQTERFV
jgi:hypothetical protein